MLILIGYVRDVAIVGYFLAVTTMMWTAHPMAHRILSEVRMHRCTAQLHVIGKALSEYKQEHGRYPYSIGELYPKYFRDGRILVCPSAEPRIRKGRSGYRVKLGPRASTSAYILAFLSPEHGATRELRGGDTPIVICAEHALDVSEEAWGQVRDAPEYIRRHGDPPYLVLRLNGRVDRVGALEVFRRGLQNSNEY